MSIELENQVYQLTRRVEAVTAKLEALAIRVTKLEKKPELGKRKKDFLRRAKGNYPEAIRLAFDANDKEAQAALSRDLEADGD